MPWGTRTARIAEAGHPVLDDYRRTSPVMDRVGRDHGLILHAGARTEDGMLIVNLWPSGAGWESAANDSRRIGAMRSAGVDPSRQQKEHHELERYVLLG